MYKSMYLRPEVNTLQYDNFIERFIESFGLRKVKHNEQLYVLENDDLIMRVKPELAEILIYNSLNREIMFKLREYFKRKS